MSKPTLYREVRGINDPQFMDGRDVHVVPVERCKHGFYVGHPVEVDGWTAHNEWCPGAGIGGGDGETR